MPSRNSSVLPDAGRIDAALDELRAGGIVALPTETVYGLAADAENPAAVARVFALKGRPAEHPLIVHIGTADLLRRYARDVPDAAWRLAARLWPGPLTLVLPRSEAVPDAVTGGQDTVALRVPGHAVALAVLTGFGRGLAAPSANRFGRVSPTTAAHVRDEFGADAPLILDGGPCEVGIESTIVDLSGAAPRILRPGRIGADAIADVIGEAVGDGAAGESPRVSGSLESHYAPAAHTELVPGKSLPARHEALASCGRRVAVLAMTTVPDGGAGLVLPADPEAYAHGLYAALRELDGAAIDTILIETPPPTEAWAAVRDRLRRASADAD